MTPTKREYLIRGAAWDRYTTREFPVKLKASVVMGARRAARLQSGRGAARRALRGRQSTDPVQVGTAQLVQAGVRELQLRLDTRRAAKLAAPGAVSQELKQGGPACPGLARPGPEPGYGPPAQMPRGGSECCIRLAAPRTPGQNPSIGHACLTARTLDQASTRRTPAGGEVNVSSVSHGHLHPARSAMSS